MEEKVWYLALDLSTQSLKAIVANEKLEITYQDSICFDTDLPEFCTENGVHRNADGCTISSPTLMWVKAVDLLLMKMVMKNIELQNIGMISGTAQQHGSVYWRSSAEITLSHLDPNTTLTDQLQDCFVLTDSPVWMDSSTTQYCRDLEERVGGSMVLADITGSKAYERFTGNQIAKVYQRTRPAYCNCERISLVSSFLASLFLGKYAPIDYSDGSGMNLLNIRLKAWDEKLLDACAPGLSNRLGPPVASIATIGVISSYMVERYNFSPKCSIIAFTGDNPASFAGMRLADTDVVISLGTSDTLIFWMKTLTPSVEGHIFVNPVDKNDFMALLCFKNGSLSREAVCNRLCNGSWKNYNAALQRTPAGNNGKLGIYFDEMEILPHAKGIFKWDENNSLVPSFQPDEEVRAVLEGQFLAKRYHAERFGYIPGTSSRILATGGASNNTDILQVLADVFQCPVYTVKETSNSACLGCIYRCKQASLGDNKQAYFDAVCGITPHQLGCEPNKENALVYDQLLCRYSKFETLVMEKNQCG